MKKPLGFILFSYFLFWLVGIVVLGISKPEKGMEMTPASKASSSVSKWIKSIKN